MLCDDTGFQCLKVCFAFVYHKSEIMVEMWFLFVVDLSG